MEYIAYYASSKGFALLGDTLLMQLRCSQTKHQEGCDTVFRLLQNLVFHPVQVMICKDQWFQAYIQEYSHFKIRAKMQKLMTNIRLKKPVADISPESFKGFSYIQVDTKHWQDAPFTWFLLRACIDSLDNIIADPNIINNNGFLLCNNMWDPMLLEDRTNRQRNRPLITVVALAILCYAQSKCYNLVQRVNA